MAKEILVKTVLNKSKKRDHWFLDDYSFNPYSSCSFNCLYCYIRGSKYGTNLERSLSVKTNALDILDKQLKHRAKKINTVSSLYPQQQTRICIWKNIIN